MNLLFNLDLQTISNKPLISSISVIHLQFWVYGSWDSLFPISMSPTAIFWVQNTIFNDKSTILLHPGTHLNKNFASQRQNYAKKMQDAQVTKSLVFIWNVNLSFCIQYLFLFLYKCIENVTGLR